MGYLSFLSLWTCLWGASPASSHKSLALAHAGSLPTDNLGWYTLTSAGVVSDKAGPYSLSGCISQSPISPVVVIDAGAFYIIGGFWSSECEARLSPNREQVLISSQKPGTFRLYSNFPNPFRQVSRIAYDLPARTRVSLSIYDIDGRRVRRLADCWQDAGRYSVIWDGKDKKGRACPTGVYFCSLKTEDHGAVKKMLLAE